MEPEILKINVEEKIGTREHAMGGGGPAKVISEDDKKRQVFANFLKKNGFTNDGSYIVSVKKDKKGATLWKKIADFEGDIVI